MRTSSLVRLSLFLWLASAAFPVWSAEWSAQPSVVLRQEYNDNILLTPLPHNAVWGTILTPSLTLSRSSEVSQTSASARLNFNRYAGESGLDRNDQYFALSSNYTSERDVWAGDASYTRDSTLTSELNQTGIVQARTQRNLLTLAPSWTRTLSERNSLKLGYEYDQASYDGSSVGLINYNNQSAQASWLYQLSESDLVNMTASYSRFQTADGNHKADTAGIQGSVTHSFSETMKGSILLGLNRTHSTISSPAQVVVIGPFTLLLPALTSSSTDVVPVLNATLEKKFETTTVNASASRTLNPTGNGVLAETDQLGLGVSHSFTENFSGSVNGAAYRSRYIGNAAIAAANSRYYELALNLNWRMNERWTLDTGYRYARVEYQVSSVAPVSNLIYASLRYDWPKISVSR